MVLMVVVVVAVGGLFVRPFAYFGDPQLHLYLWKDLWKEIMSLGVVTEGRAHK